MTVNKELVKRVDNLKAQGKVKIEFIEPSTGEVVESHETENFIASGVDTLFQIQMKNLFQRNKYTGGAPVGVLGDPFRTMYLTDATHEEDENNEWLMKGNVVGAADTYRMSYGHGAEISGMYNGAESFTADDLVRIVVDFPAPAANGDIGSIYFGSATKLISGYDTYLDVVNTRNVIYNSMVKYNNRWYCFMNGSIDVYSETFTELFNSGRPTTSNMSFRNGTVYDGHVYTIVTTNNSSRAMYKIPLSDLESTIGTMTSNNFNDAYRISASESGTSNNLRSITYLEDRQQFAIGHHEWGRSWIDICDLDLNLLKSFDTVSPNGGSNNGTAHSNLLYDNGILIHEQHTIDIDTEITTTRLGSNGINCGLDGDYLYGRDGYIYPKIGFSSRARLTSPVTKIRTLPMKVTYDFVLPSMYPDSE